MEKQQVKILIPYRIKQILDSLVASTPNEFTLFGKSEKDGDNIKLVDIRIPKQMSSGGATILNEAETEAFLTELIKDKQNPKDWNIWIHSHNTMGAFWSTTDRDQMLLFNNGGVDYFFHVVISTKEYKGACSIYKPFCVVHEDIDIEFLPVTAFDVNKVHYKLASEINKLQGQLAQLQEKLEAEQKKEPDYIVEYKKELAEKNKKPYTAQYDWDNEGKKGKHKKMGFKIDNEKTLEYYIENDCLYSWDLETGICKFIKVMSPKDQKEFYEKYYEDDYWYKRDLQHETEPDWYSYY